jgi:2'-deoxynucleoside 5'-phosphate N-hydrolase
MEMPMTSAYVAIAVRSRETLSPIIEAIKQVLLYYEVEPIIFVDRYSFSSADHAAMMELALRTLDHTDFLIAEVSEQAIGVGIEVGYAAAKGKPVLYLRRANAEFATTVAGVATHSIAYSTEIELRTKLSHIIEQMIKQKTIGH